MIEGVVSNADNCKLVLENFNAGKPIFLKDKVLAKDGKFSFSVSALDTTEIYNLVLDSTKVIRLVVKPEEKITVTTTKNTFGTHYEVIGSKESKLLQEAEIRLWNTRKKMAAIKQEIKTGKTKENSETLAKDYEQVFTKHYDYLRNFIVDNSNSLAAYLALYQMIDNENLVLGSLKDDRYVRVVAQKIKTERPNSKYLPLLMKELENRSIQKRNLRIAQIVENAKNSYPEISLKNVKSEKISLRGVNAKYVLLYFGVLNEASQNRLLPIYKKYHKSGLEIYFVDENPNITLWKEAVNDLKSPWINVHDDTRIGASIYNVQQLPTNYIIQVKGTIEGKNLFGRYLKEKLDKLF